MPENLLLVEDNAGDDLLLQSILDDLHPRHFATVSAATLKEAKAAVWEQRFDAVLLDLSLPDSHGLETVGQLAAAAPNLPIVVLTGVADEAIARKAVRCGAQDYLVKGQADATTITRAIHYAIERKQAEEALRAQQRELEAKNKELQATQRRLETYRDRYVDLYDFAPLGYVTLDEDGYVQEINLAGAQLLSADRDALTGYPFSEHVAQEDMPVFVDHLRKCVEGHCEMTSEVRLAAKDGRLISVQLHSIPIKGSQEDVTLCKTAITDITRRKEMEETIQRSRAFLQTVIDAIPDTMLVIGRDYRIILANRAARELAGGIDPTTCLTCHQLSHHRDLPCVGKDEPCPLRQVIANKAPMAVTHTHYDAEGKESFVEVTAAPVFNETGEVSYVIEACRDVTDRLRLERALRLTQFSVDRAGDAVFWLGSDARFFYANDRACQQLGYSREELLSMTVHDVDPDFPAEAWPKHWEELKRRGSFTFESQHRAKDGGFIPVEITVNYAEFEGKEFNCAFVRDITRRKRMEERLARLNSLKEQLLGAGDLNDKLKLITDSMVEVFGADFARIWLLDEGNLCERGCRHAAVTEGPDVCRDRSECLHLVASSGRYTAIDDSHCRVPVGCYMIGRIASGEEPTFVTNDVTHDPRVHDRGWAASLGLVSFAGYRLLSPKGTPLGVLALFSKREIDADDNTLLEMLANTTAQVIRTGRAEESLRREKAFADVVIDSIPGVFYVLDSQGRFVRWNRLLEEVTGLTAEMLRGTDALRTIFADDRQLVAGKIREVFEKGLAEVESRYLGKDEVREYWFTGRRMNAGPTSYLVGSGVDITERKQAENDLKALNGILDQRVAERTKALQMLHEIAVMVNQAQNAEQAMEYCLHRVAAYNGWSFGHVLLLTADKRDELVPAYVHYPEDSERFRRFREATLGIRFHRGQGLPGRVFISGKPEWSTNVRRDLIECRAVVAEDLGIATAMAFPVLVGQKVAAVLEFFSDRVIQPDGRITDAMAGIGMQLGRIVERADFEEHLLTTAEAIRRGIAQDLHDDVGQELTGLGLKAATLAEMLAAAETPAGKLAADVAVAVDRTCGKVRGLSRGLLPVELEEGLLADAIGQLVSLTTTGSRIECKFDCPHPDPVFEGPTAVHLYRIAQEAVSNAVRHSGASSIRITLDEENGETALKIEDNGEGLGSEAAQAGGMGLRTMRYRAGLIGGKLEVGPGPSGGTQVVCRLSPRNASPDP